MMFAAVVISTFNSIFCGIMKKVVTVASSLALFTSCLFAQEGVKKINLIKNGDFENGNTGFKSEFLNNKYLLSPGYYSITNNASSLNQDLRDPVQGDHTNGNGNFMIIDSDGIPGKKAWSAIVNVVPNSNYTFTAYFCNLYKHKGSDNGFVINGLEPVAHPKLNDCKIRFLINNTQVGETETDNFHMFRWISASATWYSGSSSGKVEIAIENVNYKSTGNDLALDDIEFVYLETMPPGYKPPEKTTVLAKAIKRTPDPLFQLAELKKSIREKALNQTQGDSVAPGIYTLRTRKPRQPNHYNRLYFAQGQAELQPEVLILIDSLAQWMKEEPRVRILLEGHTDNQGDPLLNIKLSEERVNKIKQYMIFKGVAASRIETIGYGGAYPISDNSSEETRKFNRRVEIKVKGD